MVYKLRCKNITEIAQGVGFFPAGCNRFSHWDPKIYLKLLLCDYIRRSDYFPTNCHYIIYVCSNALRISVAVFVAESGSSFSNATLIPGSRTACHLKVWICHGCHNYLRVLIVKANFAVGAWLKRIILLASCASRHGEFDH
jgi:hypothetical protein